MSTKRFKELEKLQKGPNGRNLCRYCSKEVEPPRRTFCSDKCVHEWRIRSSSQYARQCVLERDGGKCAICGVDCVLAEVSLKRLRREIVKEIYSNYDSYQLSIAVNWRNKYIDDPRWVEACKNYNVEVNVDLDRSLWQADHINPVVLGGGQCGLDNLRTLCLRDHKAETKALKKHLAEKRKKPK